MAKRFYKAMKKKELYAGYDERRRQEAMDSQMISEDKSQLANLPQNVVMVNYSKTPYINEPGLDDTVRGIDKQINADVKAGDVKKGDFEKY